ncbi:hypothetical protein [Burkholderia lata]|nr:hypothetical protein [Burkholderia lata]
MTARQRRAHALHVEVDAAGMGLPIRFSATLSQFDRPVMALAPGDANDEIDSRLLALDACEIAEGGIGA